MKIQEARRRASSQAKLCKPADAEKQENIGNRGRRCRWARLDESFIRTHALQKV